MGEKRHREEEEAQRGKRDRCFPSEREEKDTEGGREESKERGGKRGQRYISSIIYSAAATRRVPAREKKEREGNGERGGNERPGKESQRVGGNK